MSDHDSGRLPWTAGGRDRRPSNDTRRTPLSDEDSSDEDHEKQSRRSSNHSPRSRHSDRRRQSEISIVLERSRKQSRQSALSEIRQEAKDEASSIPSEHLSNFDRYRKHSDLDDLGIVDVHDRSFQGTEEGSKKSDAENDDDPPSRDRSTERNPHERGKWSGKLDFFLSCLGYAVGLGNIWRFPYLCYKFGGGAFLIPYLIMLFFIGIPCFFMELALGQYSAMGPITIYANIAPIFAGLGFANFFASAVVAIYYNMLLAWTIYYMIASFTTGTLPWETCDSSFNTNFCFSVNDYKNCTEYRKQTETSSSGPEEIIYHRGRCITDGSIISEIENNITYFYGCQRPVEVLESDGPNCRRVIATNYEPGVYINPNDCVELSRRNEFTKAFDLPHGIRNTAAQEYYTHEVLNESSGIDEWGVPQWKLVLCLLGAWVVIFLCLINGVHSSGKVVYFTATFPYIILVILFFRAVLLPGAWEGVKFYIIPEWKRLKDIRVWEAAAIQIFFSLGVGSGGLITMASYNNFDKNIFRDTLIISLCNCATSIFAGFAIFSVLGFLATELGVAVKDVVKSGTGLAFVAYPDLVTRLPAAPVWAVLFFAMLFTLGLDSQFTFVETLATGILDLKPSWRKRKWIVVLLISILGFLIGLPLTTRAGGYLLDLLDYYGAGWAFLFIALMELIIVSYIYGLRRFYRDLEEMFDFRPSYWLQGHMTVIFTTVSPLIILFILVYSWVEHNPLTRDDYEYPEWANIVGWVIGLIPIVAVPLIGIIVVGYRFCKRDRHYALKKKFGKLFHYTSKWRDNEEDADDSDSEDDKNSDRDEEKAQQRLARRAERKKRFRGRSTRRVRAHSGQRGARNFLRQSRKKTKSSEDGDSRPPWRF
ncbi:sodium-dependent proline transporter-like isoform X1 [Tigriopus californicus]|uniref:sodium-dependent proline transporter-like isoform X1 n=1 Tax=Tigriopus californicus TaxID=6832 RepID=UPI0027D9E7DB|nr:sodium-dependent proline transporter-like isoform X1 [Tigriopus californicus]